MTEEFRTRERLLFRIGMVLPGIIGGAFLALDSIIEARQKDKDNAREVTLQDSRLIQQEAMDRRIIRALK